MSYYLLHILRYGSVLTKRRGNLICEHKQSGKTRQIALEDLRGVILATPDVLLSDQLISTILEHNSFILHCNKKYQPIGITAPLERLTRTEVAVAQTKATDRLNAAIWSLLLTTKIRNQIAVLKRLERNTGYLVRKLKEKPINESACARFYWREYFRYLGYSGVTRRNHQEHIVNGMLNYGYAVLGALCHRSLVAHGLSPLFGVHHRGKFHSHPLVYDVIEPWRAFIDYHLSLYLHRHPQADMQTWIQRARTCWEYPVKMDNNDQQKLVDAMDYCAQSLANVFSRNKKAELWLPKMV